MPAATRRGRRQSPVVPDDLHEEPVGPSRSQPEPKLGKSSGSPKKRKPTIAQEAQSEENLSSSRKTRSGKVIEQEVEQTKTQTIQGENVVSEPSSDSDVVLFSSVVGHRDEGDDGPIGPVIMDFMENERETEELEPNSASSTQPPPNPPVTSSSRRVSRKQTFDEAPEICDSASVTSNSASRMAFATESNEQMKSSESCEEAEDEMVLFQNSGDSQELPKDAAPILSAEENGLSEQNVAPRDEQAPTQPDHHTEDHSGPPRLEMEEEGGLEHLEEGTVLLMEDETAQRLAAIGGKEIHYELAPPGRSHLNQLIDRTSAFEENVTAQFAPSVATDLRAVEFNFLDNKNICCGLCGEIVPYEQLMSEHLPDNHPEILEQTERLSFDEVPYAQWLKQKLVSEKESIESGFKLTQYASPARLSGQSRIQRSSQRRVSQIRVNPDQMNLPQLDAALKKKMVEKMGRKVPVTLVDKQHARCGLCNAVVSLNKKFEVVHLVRHFNAWHPSAHRCAGTWMDRPPTRSGCKPLSMHDFAVIDSNQSTPDNLQCIWCGMFMDTDSLAMHFDEVHPEDIEVPKCNLCLQELVMNARMQEKYGDDFEITLPDEHHIRCGRYGNSFTTEGAMEKAIERRIAKGELKEEGEHVEEEEDEDGEGLNQQDDAGPEAFLNSRMALGRRKKPKRQFIMPALRQAAPIDSEFVEPVTECQWKCKMCNKNILAAVISAGAIKHYRTCHPEHLDNMQYELCKARLERVSDGCMEFVHPQLIECLLCNMTYNLHKPFNMCRAIRHLKSKHPNLMPEYSGSPAVAAGSGQLNKGSRSNKEPPEMELRMVDNMDQLRELGIDISRMESVTGVDGEQLYIMMPDGEELDPQAASDLAAAIAGGNSGEFRIITQESIQEEQPASRVFTLSVGKQGSLVDSLGMEVIQEPEKASTSDMLPRKMRLNQGPPMPEPLTTD